MPQEKLTSRPHMDDFVERCLRRLPPPHPVRIAAESIAAGDSLTDQAIELLISASQARPRLSSAERIVAVWSLGECRLSGELKDRASEALRRVMKGGEFQGPDGRLIQPLSGNTPVMKPVAAILLLLFVTLLSATLAALGTFPYSEGSSDEGGETVAFVILFGVLWVAFMVPVIRTFTAVQASYAKNIQAVTARSLGKLEDPLAVGLLAEAQCHRDKDVSDAACEALPPCLAAVREEHYGLLPPDAVPSLGWLMYRVDRPQAIPILEALGRAGDGRAAEDVGQLMAALPASAAVGQVRSTAMYEKELEVLEVVKRVLPILKERLKQETSAARLLRPAEAPGAPRDILLRPAGAASAVPEEQLLRPSVGPDGRSE